MRSGTGKWNGEGIGVAIAMEGMDDLYQVPQHGRWSKQVAKFFFNFSKMP